MDFSKIKLVVSDMDGTLLNSNHQVSTRFFNQFKQLQKHNIHFVAASGRQYYSIVDKLDAIKNDISIIAENGSFMQHDNRQEVLLELSKNEAVTCIKKLRQIPNCYIVLCGKNAAYLETNDTAFVTKLSEFYKSYSLVPDLTKISNDTFLKIAVYHFETAKTGVLPHVQDIAQEFQITISGKNWLDISHKKANKGYALTKLQNKLGIKPHETLVFGDYNNDLSMLERAYFSYAMANAHPDVKKTARFETKSNVDGGVEFIIDELLSLQSKV